MHLENSVVEILKTQRSQLQYKILQQMYLIKSNGETRSGEQKPMQI